MGERTTISWTDHTFSPWWGCDEVSPGCDHCYARTLAGRFEPKVKLWGSVAEGGARLVFDNKPRHWNEPLGWNKRAAKAGVRERVFCASMADVFDNHPAVVDERASLWSLIHKTPALDWLLLTKRIGNVKRMVHEPWLRGHWPSNAWLGITVVNQEEADRDIPKLLELPAPVRFLSIEPMLGPVDLMLSMPIVPGGKWDALRCSSHIDWVICGGESGRQARPMHPAWARSLRDQCGKAGVPFHFKQWGEWGPVDSEKNPAANRPGSPPPNWDGLAGTRLVVGQRMNGDAIEALWPVKRAGKAAAGRLLDGVEHNAFPTTVGAP